jgi:hypothetical protein
MCRELFKWPLSKIDIEKHNVYVGSRNLALVKVKYLFLSLPQPLSAEDWRFQRNRVHQINFARQYFVVVKA